MPAAHRTRDVMYLPSEIELRGQVLNFGPAVRRARRKSRPDPQLWSSCSLRRPDPRESELESQRCADIGHVARSRGADIPAQLVEGHRHHLDLLEFVKVRRRDEPDIAGEKEVAPGARQAGEHEVLPEQLEELPVVSRLLAELSARRRQRRLARLDESGWQRVGDVTRAVLVLPPKENISARRDRNRHREVPELHEVHVCRQPAVRQPASVLPDGEEARPERPRRLERLPAPDAIRAHFTPRPMNASTSSRRPPPDRNRTIPRSTSSRTVRRGLSDSPM